ncbi:MAG: hypothetical protein A3B74_02770 [Candidatus Kerfeldbacteria bacterium RIFCSPHIGHO2_02_FULL_42_14]|uniref:Bacterial type II secretion system protein E domain-containing protein n=1 Tax=Candidatus Kerfeldbacteria bacterium RIFCSPHIGHO2_02_FULL_42_14 TaxID=1798540 RepID=A0A1G2ARX6_9BACT|nr:MAG: hypothetical protein A3B74_02770 [Candidatus Kerfeldbacteria bacterium RIFCSPHIGHO2_02_FULL_42_14]OGY80463.1 MAG: hypothetical protein A3E60_05390 [Candidatus Kerfeldbacteria bacterium RIFCSPHIGHO2_12_FULL_42_13]OGY83893.1 MAG: hypothetical protein A3I91_04915 [Candidatus Kerfeldbacteria bacterium RIFCSPLOWO2_02_FULL_42_19]OGY86568.1 MAG: hypothetical protein A3G01_04915 [Candidatus Kerfeldbacteria bacterium RIFCSPLOWO2_12_FULL_43_9]
MDTASLLSLKKFLATVEEYRASDLHLSVGNPPTLRVNGQLIPIKETVVTPKFVTEIADAILTADQKQKLQEQKELIVTFDFESKKRFRIHFFFQQGYISASIRSIHNMIPTPDQLGIPTQITQRLLGIHQGLVLYVGSFGSGRTTTVASLVNHINNQQAWRIITIEQPVEYIFADNKSIIEQREVGKDASTWSQALESVLDEDVQLVVVSDVLGEQVLEKILEVAESGRLVYSTMNASHTVSAIERIINMLSSEKKTYMMSKFSSVLEAIVGQKLIPGVDGGLKLAMEIFIPNSMTRTLIKEGSLYQLSHIIQTSQEESIQSFDLALVELVQQHKIALERAMEHAHNKEAFRAFFR